MSDANNTIESTETCITYTTEDRDEFLEHMEEADAQLHTVDGFLETWTTCFVGKDHVIAGTWDHFHNIGTLDLL